MVFLRESKLVVFMMRNFIQLFILAFSLLSLSFPANGQQTHTVTNPLDIGLGSLRNVVNGAGIGDTIRFADNLNGATLVLLSGPISIDTRMVIVGNGTNQTTISGGSFNQLFVVSNVNPVELSNLTLEDGVSDNGGALAISNGRVVLKDVTIRNCVAEGDESGEGGGGVYLENGNLVVENGSFTDNQATGSSGSGGAILVGPSSGLTITGTQFESNAASRAGGAIEINNGGSGSMSISGAIFEQNTTGANPGNGGAIHITGSGGGLISNSEFLNNAADQEGGAVWNGSGVVQVQGALFQGNQSQGSGGGVYNSAGTLVISDGTSFLENSSSTDGGALLNATGAVLIMSDALLVENVAQGNGGAISDQSNNQTLLLSNVDFEANAASNGGAVHLLGASNMQCSGGSATNNSASESGGAFVNGSGTMEVSAFRFATNSAAGMQSNQGGGAIFNGPGGGLTMTNVDFDSNTAQSQGGAILDQSGVSSVVSLFASDFEQNAVSNSNGKGGAVVFSESGNAVVEGCKFIGNQSAGEAGGIWSAAGIFNMVNCVFAGNTSNGNGGALYFLEGQSTIQSTSYNLNVASGQGSLGGAVYLGEGVVSTIQQSTFTGNSSTSGGGAIADESEDASQFLVSNCTLDSNFTLQDGVGGALFVGDNGDVLVVDTDFSGNSAQEQGGAIWHDDGSMEIVRGSFDGNTISGEAPDHGGGAIYCRRGSLVLRNGIGFTANTANEGFATGGALHVSNGSELRIDTCTFTDNEASRGGGALADASGPNHTTHISESNFTGNLASGTLGAGGAIHLSGGGSLSALGTSFSGNQASVMGGAIWTGLSEIIVAESMFTENVANGTENIDGGGAIYNNGGTVELVRISAFNHEGTHNGGVVYNQAGILTVRHSTFSANSCTGNGAGVFNFGKTGLYNCTLVKNKADGSGGAYYSSSFGDTLLAKESLWSKNTGDEGDHYALGNGVAVSLGYNLMDKDDNGAIDWLATDIIGTSTDQIDPLLGVLAGNGGKGPSHTLRDFSPAINKGDPENDEVDQRGQGVVFDRKDIGAIECISCLFNGIGENPELGFRLYPNPGSGEALRIEGKSKLDEVRVFNVEAEMVVRVSGELSAGEIAQLASLQPGLYFVQLFSEGQFQTVKWIVE